MGLVNNLKSFIAKGLDKTGWTPIGRLSGFTTRDLVANTSDAELLNFYRSWAKIAIDSIATRVAQVEFVVNKINKDGTKEKVDNSPILDLLYRVNNFQSKQDFFRYIVSYKLLVGKSPVLKLKENGRTKELRLLPPIGFSPKTDKANGALEGYELKLGTDTKDYKVEDILLFKEFDPFDIYDGISTTKTSVYALATMMKLESWEYRFFEQGGIPPFHISYEEKMDEEAMKEVKTIFKQQFSGEYNAFDPIITSGGGKVEKTGLSPKDIALNELEAAYRDKILGLYGVPKAVVGIVEDVNRANAEASLITFMENTVKPQIQAIVDTLNEGLVPEFNSATEEYELDFVNPTPTDRKLEAEINNIRLAWTTQNEIRETEGLDSHPEGDKLKPVGGNTLTLTPGQGTNQESYNILVNNISKSIKLDNLKDYSNADIREATRAKFLAKAISVENKLVKQMKNYSKGLEERLLKNLRTNKSYSFIKGIENTYDYRAETEILMDIIQPFYTFASQEAINDLLEELGLDMTLNPSEELMKLLNKLSEDAVLEISSTSKRLLIESLLEGVNNGEGINKLEDRVKGFIKDLSDKRAFTIAQTETTTASNLSFNNTFADLDVPFKEWFSLMDNRERPSHGDTDGQVVRTTETFKLEENGVIIGEFEYPGQKVVDIKYWISCRCRQLPNYKGPKKGANNLHVHNH